MSSNLRLDWCSYAAAKFACQHWHYSKRIQAGKTAQIGVYEDSVFKGAVIYTHGSGMVYRTGDPFGLTQFNVAELARVALKSHDAPVTRIIAISLRMLKKAMPGLKLIVSYADPREGHHGGIYQGGGWIFVGQSKGDHLFVDKHGKEYHSRNVSPTGVKEHFGTFTRCPSTKDLTLLKTPGKYKYLMPLDDEVRKKVVLLAKPYPKKFRGVSVDSDTPGFHSGKGGAHPTTPLPLSRTT